MPTVADKGSVHWTRTHNYSITEEGLVIYKVTFRRTCKKKLPCMMHVTDLRGSYKTVRVVVLQIRRDNG